MENPNYWHHDSWASGPPLSKSGWLEQKQEAQSPKSRLEGQILPGSWQWPWLTASLQPLLPRHMPSSVCLCVLYSRGVKVTFARGHTSPAVAFKGPNVILGPCKCNLLLNSSVGARRCRWVETRCRARSNKVEGRIQPAGLVFPTCTLGHSLGHIFKFFGYSIFYTVLNIQLSILYLPICTS